MDTGRPSSYAGLTDKTVFITGGGIGIGAAFTRAFAAHVLRGASRGAADEAAWWRRHHQPWFHYLEAQAHWPPGIQRDQGVGHRVDTSSGSRIWPVRHTGQHDFARGGVDR